VPYIVTHHGRVYMAPRMRRILEPIADANKVGRPSALSFCHRLARS